MSALNCLLSFPRFGPLGVIERMGEMVASLTTTQWWQEGRCIKIVGSNGKGTTAGMMAQMGQEMGLRVGLFTSPHILRPSERIRINGVEIAQDAFDEVLDWSIDQAVEGAGRFELLTLAALKYFADENVDLAIMEIGLGGRFDPVKIAPGRVAALTSIDLEHTAILGDTFEEIAAEKAAVCKAGDLLVSAIGDVQTRLPEGVDLIDLSQPVLAPDQSNARLAAYALKEHLGVDTIPEISFFKMQGRFQKVSHDPLIYVDVAHSPAAVKTVLRKIKQSKFALICAARNDKDIAAMAAQFDDRLTQIVALQLEDGMSLPEDILAVFDGVPGHVAHSVEEALSLTGKEDCTLCLGGFTLVAHVLAHHQNYPVEKLIHI